MSDDDTFTGGIAGHVRRIAERQEADRQRTEEQARGPIRCCHDSHRLIVYHGLSEPTLPCLWRAVTDASGGSRLLLDPIRLARATR